MVTLLVASGCPSPLGRSENGGGGTGAASGGVAASTGGRSETATSSGGARSCGSNALCFPSQSDCDAYVESEEEIDELELGGAGGGFTICLLSLPIK